MLKKVSDKIWQISFPNFGSNIYLLEDSKTIIDTGSRENKEELLHDLKKLNLVPSNIKKVLLTHLHFDHIGNLSLFKNAAIYASKEEIASLNKNAEGTVLAAFDSEIISELKKIRLIPLPKSIARLKVLLTPGHSAGSVCFYMQKEKILFSGDTLFEQGIGRLDLPTSKPEKMKTSLNKLKKLKHKILCPGH